MRLSYAALLTICLATFASGQTMKAPATRPAEANFQVAEPREQLMEGFTFCYLSTHASMASLRDEIAIQMPKLEKAMSDQSIRPAGPVVFIYQGTPEDFTLDIGVEVAEGSKPVGEFLVRQLPPFHCATVLYSGPLGSIGRSFEQLMPWAFRRYRPTSQWREAYLHWRGAESANNVVHIEVGIN